VCCSVLQCDAACCSVLHYAALCCSMWAVAAKWVTWQCVAVHCSVLQCVALCCTVLQCVGSELQCVALCCTSLHHVAVCALQLPHASSSVPSWLLPTAQSTFGNKTSHIWVTLCRIFHVCQFVTHRYLYNKTSHIWVTLSRYYLAFSTNSPRLVFQPYAECVTFYRVVRRHSNKTTPTRGVVRRHSN